MGRRLKCQPGLSERAERVRRWVLASPFNGERHFLTLDADLRRELEEKLGAVVTGEPMPEEGRCWGDTLWKIRIKQ